jgi:uncharacterized membrane protein YkvA (DUF1232 family)
MNAEEDSVRVKLIIGTHLRRTRISSKSGVKELKQKLQELSVALDAPKFRVAGHAIDNDDQLLAAIDSALSSDSVLRITVVEGPVVSVQELSPKDLARKELHALPAVELKKMLDEEGEEYSDCIEKSDYVQRIVEAQQRIALERIDAENYRYTAPLPPWRQLLDTISGPSDLSSKMAMIKERLPSYLKLPDVAAVKPAMQQMWRLLCDPAAAQGSKLLVAAALLYVVSPLDFIPDFIPLIGFTDDIAVVTGAASYLGYELTKYVQQEEQEEEEHEEEQHRQQQQQQEEEQHQEEEPADLGDVVNGIVDVAGQAASQIAVGASVIAEAAGERAATMAAAAGPYAANMATTAGEEMQKVEKALGETAANMVEAAEARVEAKRASTVIEDPTSYLGSLGLEELRGIATALELELSANATKVEAAKAIADAQGADEQGRPVAASLRDLGENVLVGAVTGAVATMGIVQGGVETTRRSLAAVVSNMAAVPTHEA